MHATQASMPPKQQQGAGLGSVVQVSHICQATVHYPTVGLNETHMTAARTCLHLFAILLSALNLHTC